MIYTDVVVFNHGATPLTFDGNKTLRFNARARKLVGMSVGHSLSVYTTDEGYAMGVRLSENSGLGGKNPVFVAGNVAASGPGTNTALKPTAISKVNLDIELTPNSTMRIDISTLAGATQTGTHDCTITFFYSDQDEEPDFWQYHGSNIPARGGTWAYTTALATTTETALTGNGTTLNIPAEATEIIGVNVLHVVDTAVTADEEIGGKARLDFGLEDQGKQEYAANGGIPGTGTEVEGGAPFDAMDNLHAASIPNLPQRELQTSAYVTASSAITGGADWLVNILYR